MIKIITDSTSYMTKEYAEENDIRIIPLNILLGNRVFVEGMPGTFDSVFETLIGGDDLSKSSQPSPDAFKEAFEKVLSEGNEVLAITISSALSGTYNAARLAASMCGKNGITVYDSRACAQLMLLAIEEAVSLIKAGKTRAEIVSCLDALSHKSSEIFVPVTLKHLIRGGRIGGLQAVIGTLLSVKPLLAFSNGILSCKKKVLGIQKALRELIAEIPQTVNKIYVMHIHKSEYFRQLWDGVKQKFPFIELKQGEVGPVVGIHVGPGTIGIAYTSK